MGRQRFISLLFLSRTRRVTGGKRTSTIRISPFLLQSGPSACAQRNEAGSPETTSKTLSIATSYQPRRRLGAIAGNIIGSVCEHRNVKKTQFPLFHPLCRFTDDMVQTVALAESILDGIPYARLLRSYYLVYLHAGYGERFHKWAQSEAWFNSRILAGDKSEVAGVELATASEPPARQPRIWGRRPSSVDPSHP